MSFPHTFQELDRGAGLAKGSAFRAFKRLLPELREGRDFIVLDARRDQARIAALRAQGKIYVSSRNVVLLDAATAAKLRAILG